MENGQVVLDFQGNSVRNFPFLPRYISVRPSGWLIEFWMRSDTRLTYRDIKARMSAAKEDLPSDNVLNMRRERDARKPLGLSCWTARRGGVTKAEIERIEQLSAENVAYNTALKIQRGTESVMLESKSFYPNDTPHYYPVNIFLDSGEEVHTPGQRLDVCIQLLFDLQVLATDLGFDDWRDLPDYRLPTWWTKVRAKVDGEQTNARKSEHYSKTGSAMSTPKAAPRTRMSWKTPRRTHTSAIPSVQTPVGVITPLNTPSSVTPQSAPRFNGTSMGLAGHSYHHFPAYGLNESHGLHQGYQYSSWGPQHLQSSPISDITYQSSDVDMMLDDSPIRLNPIQEQTHFALAAVTNTQANVNDYLGMDDPFLDEVPYLHSSVDYNNFLGNMAMQIFEHQQAAGYPEFSNTQGLGMQRFNGHKGFSIRENAAHKLNINTDIIMDRSNPFGMLQDFDSKQPMSPKRSFEEFLVEDLPF